MALQMNKHSAHTHTHTNEQYSKYTRIVLAIEFTIDLTNASPYHEIVILQTAILHTNIISLFFCVCCTEQQTTASYTALEKFKTFTKVPRNHSQSVQMSVGVTTVRSSHDGILLYRIFYLSISIYIYFFTHVSI